MIQRKQSLFLLGALALLITSLFFPVWTGTSPGASGIVKAFEAEVIIDDVTTQFSTYYIGLNYVLAALLVLVTIFLFKNRTLQMRLCSVSIFLIVAGLLSGYLMGTAAIVAMHDYENVIFGMGFILPIIAIPLIMLAHINIKKDERLVKSVDRIR